MITLKETNELLDKKINKTLKEIEAVELKAKDALYSQDRTIESISESTTNVLLVRRRFDALNKLKKSILSIKKSDENKDSTQKILIQVKDILEDL